MAPLAALLLAASPHAASEPFVALEAGAWRGGGYRGDDGRFSRCALTRRASEPPVTLAVGADGALSVSLGAPQLGEPGALTAELLLDGAALGDFPATPSETGLEIRLGRGAGAGARLRGAGTLEVRTAAGRVRASVSGAGAALARLSECRALARTFARGTPLSPPDRARDSAGDDTSARVRALLEAAGLERVDFDAPERLGAATARLAWTSGAVLGFVTLESRSERSTAELDRHHLGVYSSGCGGPPELRGAAPVALSGYTLQQTVVECRVRDGVRIAVVTSILDAVDVLSFVHMGLAPERERLEDLHRSLGALLRVLLRL